MVQTKILLAILELPSDGEVPIIGNQLGGGNTVRENTQ